jgi:predicted RNA-binding Zn-ribbon protein involved in translation (DUF1610 family)
VNEAYPFYCVACHWRIGGIARAGIPCPNCLHPLIDIELELAKLAETYDPVKMILEAGRQARG